MSTIKKQTEKNTQGSSDQDVQNPNVNAVEQLETLAEGKVADAVEQATRRDIPRRDDIKIDDYASDLDRKKAEQAEAREAVKADRRAGVDVDGSLGQGRLGNEDLKDV